MPGPPVRHGRLLFESETDRGEGRFKGRQLMEMVHEPAALTMVAFTMKQREFDRLKGSAIKNSVRIVDRAVRRLGCGLPFKLVPTDRGCRP